MVWIVVSRVPLATTYAGQSHWTTPVPVVIYGLLMVAVSLAFVRLLYAASRHASSAQLAAHNLVEARLSLALAGTFLLGALCAWFVPRSAFLFYATTPLVRRLHRSLSGQHESSSRGVEQRNPWLLVEGALPSHSQSRLPSLRSRCRRSLRTA